MVKADLSIGTIAQLVQKGTPEAMERASHFAIQGGAEGFFSERDDLAFYLMRNSETPDRFANSSEMASKRGSERANELRFPFSTPDEFYSTVAGFYASQRPMRGITEEKVRDFMKLHTYSFTKEEGKLKISDVGNLAGMLANCF